MAQCKLVSGLCSHDCQVMQLVLSENCQIQVACQNARLGELLAGLIDVEYDTIGRCLQLWIVAIANDANPDADRFEISPRICAEDELRSAYKITVDEATLLQLVDGMLVLAVRRGAELGIQDKRALYPTAD